MSNEVQTTAGADARDDAALSVLRDRAIGVAFGAPDIRKPGEVITADDLMQWAQAARAAHEIAGQLASTAFVSKTMARRPDEVTGAILVGVELGLYPMAALRSIDIIDGTPALRAHALRGLVLAHGHEIWVEESTATRAVVCGRRKGTGRTERSTWTMDRAKTAGLAGKRNWVNNPTAMLVARGTAEVARLVAADVLLGMPYAVEELTDEDPEPVAEGVAHVIDKTPKKRRTAQRTTPAEPPPAAPDDVPTEPAEPVAEAEPPPLHPDVLPDEPQAPTTESQAIAVFEGAGLAPEVIEPGAPAGDVMMISDAQLARMLVEMRKAGMEERTTRLAFCSDIVGRELGSSKEMTMREATGVINALVALNDNGEPAEPEDVPPW